MQITDEVEQEAYVTAITVAYNVRHDRERAIKVDPDFAEEFPECFVSEVRTALRLLAATAHSPAAGHNLHVHAVRVRTDKRFS